MFILGGDLTILLKEKEEYLDSDADAALVADADAPVVILAVAAPPPPLELVVIGLEATPAAPMLEIGKRGMLRERATGCLGCETSRCFPSMSRDDLVVCKASTYCCSAEQTKRQ